VNFDCFSGGTKGPGDEYRRLNGDNVRGLRSQSGY